MNPNVDRVPWSQKTERRIGLPFYDQLRATLMFNGYADQVASMYAGMDLRNTTNDGNRQLAKESAGNCSSVTDERLSDESKPTADLLIC